MYFMVLVSLWVGVVANVRLDMMECKATFLLWDYQYKDGNCPVVRDATIEDLTREDITQ